MLPLDRVRRKGEGVDRAQDAAVTHLFARALACSESEAKCRTATGLTTTHYEIAANIWKDNAKNPALRYKATGVEDGGGGEAGGGEGGGGEGEGGGSEGEGEGGGGEGGGGEGEGGGGEGEGAGGEGDAGRDDGAVQDGRGVGWGASRSGVSLHLSPAAVAAGLRTRGWQGRRAGTGPTYTLGTKGPPRRRAPVRGSARACRRHEDGVPPGRRRSTDRRWRRATAAAASERRLRRATMAGATATPIATATASDRGRARARACRGGCKGYYA